MLQLCDQWKIDSYIQSGSFGRGWVGVDTAHDNQKVFVKTFRSFSDRPRRRKGDQSQAEIQRKQEGAIRKEIEVLLHPKVGLFLSSAFIFLSFCPSVLGCLLRCGAWTHRWGRWAGSSTGRRTTRGW